MNPDIARRRHAKAAQARLHSDTGGQVRVDRAVINVGDYERQASIIGGAVLAGYGLLRGSLSGLVMAAIGGALAWRGYTGHCDVYQALGHTSVK